MALFSRKKKEEKAVDEAPVVAKSAPVKPKKVKASSEEDVARILLNPRITEKATENSANGVYVFDVAIDANKKQIEKAVRTLYKVEPRKIRVTSIPVKKVRNARTGMIGVKSAGKKAYIYLKSGDSISVM